MNAPLVTDGERIVIVGSGIAGLTTAYLLATRTRACVTLLEADDRTGGHTHTHALTDPEGATHRVDSGFIVHNDRTYPELLRLFSELAVPTQETEMSMSIRVESAGIEYAGGRGAGGLLARPRQLLDRRFVRMLTQVTKFHRAAAAHLTASDDPLLTFGEFLDRHGFSDELRDWYARPLVACVWSTGAQTALDYPARYLFRFLDHHGMLQVKNSPQWRTVIGGSHAYVDKILAHLPDVRTGARVTSVRRDGAASEPVTVTVADGQRFAADRVVLAGHADQMLAVLDDATDAERDVLGAFRYTNNRALVHSDASLLPVAPRARASWNYRVTDHSTDAPPIVTYWMNRLQRLDAPRPYLVSLNADHLVDPQTVLAEVDYTHPIYDAPSVAAQERLGELTTARTAFVGAYHGWGFHEDGCRSGVAAAAAWGVTW